MLVWTDRPSFTLVIHYALEGLAIQTRCYCLPSGPTSCWPVQGFPPVEQHIGTLPAMKHLVYLCTVNRLHTGVIVFKPSLTNWWESSVRKGRQRDCGGTRSKEELIHKDKAPVTDLRIEQSSFSSFQTLLSLSDLGNGVFRPSS